MEHRNKYNQLHAIDKPARIAPDGTPEFWFEGVLYPSLKEVEKEQLNKTLKIFQKFLMFCNDHNFVIRDHYNPATGFETYLKGNKHGVFGGPTTKEFWVNGVQYKDIYEYTLALEDFMKLPSDFFDALYKESETERFYLTKIIELKDYVSSKLDSLSQTRKDISAYETKIMNTSPHQFLPAQEIYSGILDIVPIELKKKMAYENLSLSAAAYPHPSSYYDSRGHENLIDTKNFLDKVQGLIHKIRESQQTKENQKETENMIPIHNISQMTEKKTQTTPATTVQTIKETIKSDGKKALVRISGRKITGLATQQIVKVLSKNLKGKQKTNFESMLLESFDSKEGEALIGLLIGTLLPQAKEIPGFGRFSGPISTVSEELRVEGMSVVGEKLLDTLQETMGSVLPAASSILENLLTAEKEEEELTASSSKVRAAVDPPARKHSSSSKAEEERDDKISQKLRA